MEEMLFPQQHWVLLRDSLLPNFLNFKTRSTSQTLLELFAVVAYFWEWFPSVSSCALRSEVPICPSHAALFGVSDSVRDHVMQNS